MGALLAFGSALDVVEYIQKQLSHFTYTFPKAKLVSHLVSTDSL
jgi:hypothetical protein